MSTATLTPTTRTIRQAETFAAVMAAGSRAFSRSYELARGSVSIKRLTEYLLDEAITALLIAAEEAGEIATDDDCEAARAGHDDAKRRVMAYLFLAK